MRNRLWIVGLLALLSLGACRDATENGGSQSLKVYRHAMDGAPGSLDPVQAGSIYANFVVLNLYDTLYRYKYLARPYELTPNLAAAMPDISDDGLTLTITLRRGRHFVDDPVFENGAGREVTAHDFVYSLKRHFDPKSRAQGAWLWQGRIEGLDAWKTAGSDYDAPVPGLLALDDHTVQIRLTRPFPQFVHTLAQGFAAIVPREAVEAYGQALSNHAVGSGPFRLVSRDSARAVLERNPEYRATPFHLDAEGYDPRTQSSLGLQALEGRTPPFLDRVDIEFITEDAARWNAFSSGEVHFIKVPVSQFDAVLEQRNPPTPRERYARDHRFEASPEAGFIYTNFNMADPRIGHHDDAEQDRRNRALRCAVVKAFDWERRNSIFFYDIGRVFPGVLPPAVPEYDAEGDHSYIERDLEGAKALLGNHGWDADTLPTLTYGFPNSVTERQIFEQFRGFMTEAGYPSDKIKPRVFATYGDYQRAYSQGKVTLINSSWTMDYPDAENLMQLYYGPNAAPGSNSASYRNAEYDRLFEAAATLDPSPRRTEIYRRMNRLLIDDCATIAGISRTLLFLWNRRAIMKPDRSFVGGYFLRFVDMADEAAGPP